VANDNSVNTSQHNRDRFNALTVLDRMEPPPKSATPGLREAAKDRMLGRTAAELLAKIEAANPR
jgi:hypothetical protein